MFWEAENEQNLHEAVNNYIAALKGSRAKVEDLLRAMAGLEELGRLQEGVNLARRFADFVEQKGSAQDRCRFLGLFAVLLAQAGEPAEDTLKELRRISPRKAEYRRWLGLYACAVGDYASGARLLRSSFPKEGFWLSLALAMDLRYDQARQTLHDLRNRFGGSQIMLRASCLENLILLLEGKYDESLSANRIAWPRLKQARNLATLSLASFTMGMAHAAKNEFGFARAYLAIARGLGRERKPFAESLSVLLNAFSREGWSGNLGWDYPEAQLASEFCSANASLALAKRSVAASSLQRCFEIAEEKGLWGWVALLGQAFPGPLAFAVKNGLSREKVESIAETNPRVKRGRDTLRVFLLGRREMAFGPRKADLPPGKSGELLALLSKERTRRVDREYVIGLLWPEMSPDRGRKNYYKAMSRARTALRELGLSVPAKKPRHMVDLGVDLWTDAEEFLCLVDAARSMKKLGDEELAEGFFTEALKLYEGEFLPGVSSIWASEERELLRAGFIEANLFLGRKYCNHEPERALGHARRVLGTDPFNEAAAQIIIDAFLEIGSVLKAQHFYDRFTSEFARAMGSEPSITLRKDNPRRGSSA